MGGFLYVLSTIRGISKNITKRLQRNNFMIKSLHTSYYSYFGYYCKRRGDGEPNIYPNHKKWLHNMTIKITFELLPNYIKTCIKNYPIHVKYMRDDLRIIARISPTENFKFPIDPQYGRRVNKIFTYTTYLGTLFKFDICSGNFNGTDIFHIVGYVCDPVERGHEIMGTEEINNLFKKYMK